MKYILVNLITWLILMITMGFLQYIKHLDRVCFFVTCIMMVVVSFIQLEMRNK